MHLDQGPVQLRQKRLQVAAQLVNLLQLKCDMLHQPTHTGVCERHALG